MILSTKNPQTTNPVVRAQNIINRYVKSPKILEYNGHMKPLSQNQVVLFSGIVKESVQITDFQKNGFVFISGHNDLSFDKLKSQCTHFANLSSGSKDNDLWIGYTGTLKPCTQPHAPIIISYYTEQTNYEKRAENLLQSIKDIGELPYCLVGLEDSGSWEVNCSRKAQFILDTLEQAKRSVLWVDADAMIHQAPSIDNEFDFAVHRFDGWEFASGTLFFNYTPASIELLKCWIRLCEEKPLIWDQMLLDEAWCLTSEKCSLATHWLPEDYTFIFDRKRDKLLERMPIIEHFQESRKLTKRRKKPLIPESLISSRMAGRSSTEFFPDVHSEFCSKENFNRSWPGVDTDFDTLTQYAQDIALRRSRPFYFVQVGAMDGISFDPIYDKATKNSWHGLLIEPLKDIFEDLKHNYSAQDGLNFINAAIDGSQKERVIYRIPKKTVLEKKIPEWALGISSFYNDRNALGGCKVDSKTNEIVQKYITKETVPCVTFSELFEEFKPVEIDLLCIDTEGHDWQVLKIFPFGKFKPKIICFEHYNLPAVEIKQALRLLESNGYAYSSNHKDVIATLLRYPIQE